MSTSGGDVYSYHSNEGVEDIDGDDGGNITYLDSGKRVPETATDPTNSQSSMESEIGDNYVNEFRNLDQTNLINAGKDEAIDTNIDGKILAIGYSSPLSSLSSQGSVSSAGYVDNEIEKLLETRNISKSPNLNIVLSREEQKVLEGFCHDQSTTTRFLTLLNAEFHSFSIASGHEYSDEAIAQLKQRLQTENQTMLLGRIGKVYWDKLSRKLDYGNADDATTRQGETSAAKLVKETVTSAPFVADDGGQDLEGDNEIKNEQMEVDSLSEDLVVAQNVSVEVPPQVPNFSNVGNKAILKRSESSPFMFTNEALEKAYDNVNRESERGKQVEKAGRVLFDAAFTEEEILTCNVSGKRKLREFDSDKIRAINRTLVWLLRQKEGDLPSCAKTTAALSAAMTEDRRLPRVDEDLLRTKVLVEHAHRRRKKLNLAICTRLNKRC